MTNSTIDALSSQTWPIKTNWNMNKS